MPALRCLIRRWRALESWIERSELRAQHYAFGTVALADVLTRRVTLIDRDERPLDQLNVIAKVSFGGDLFLRNENEKRGYKGPLLEALPGDLIISKIRARQGSICIIGDEFDHVAVSPEYPVYTPDCERVHPGYLILVLRTPGFLAQLAVAASGNTTKRRIRPEFFESRRIPLPPLNKQRAIVAAHRAALDRAAVLEREADEIEARAMVSFEAALGFSPPAPLPERPVFIASFKDLDRWSHEGILRRISEGDTAQASPYPTVRLRDVIADLENGWSPKCHDRPAEPDEWGVLKVSAASSGDYREIENKALPGEAKPKKNLEIQAGQVLITRASGVAHLVGVAAFVERTRKKLLLCDKIFRIVDSEDMKVDNRFIAHVLGIHSVRAQIEREFSTKSKMMKNVSKPVLMGLTFPLPQKPEQIAMSKALADARGHVADLREKARTERDEAWTNFEGSVYATEDDAEPPA